MCVYTHTLHLIHRILVHEMFDEKLFVQLRTNFIHRFVTVDVAKGTYPCTSDIPFSLPFPCFHSHSRFMYRCHVFLKSYLKISSLITLLIRSPLRAFIKLVKIFDYISTYIVKGQNINKSLSSFIYMEKLLELLLNNAIFFAHIL